MGYPGLQTSHDTYLLQFVFLWYDKQKQSRSIGRRIEVVKDILKYVISKVEDGTDKKEVFLVKAFELKDIGAAHQYMEKNRAVGKVVVRIP